MLTGRRWDTGKKYREGWAKGLSEVGEAASSYTS